VSDVTKVIVTTIGATFFLDLLELSFARIAGFIRTLRFWLYFVLHLIISALACFLLHPAISSWYMLSLAGTFLGVGVLSNSDVKIGGANLAPIGTLFKEIKAKMVEQAAEDKANKLLKMQEDAELAGRLRKLTRSDLEGYAGDALTGAGWKSHRVNQALKKAAQEGDPQRSLAELMLRRNRSFVVKNIDQWESSKSVPKQPAP
jgi:hypothetical protein